MFDTVGAPNELTMICYFWKGLKPFIKVKIKQQDQALPSFKEMMQKVVNAKAKAGLNSSIIIRNADSYYPRGYCPSQNTFAKMQTHN